MKERLVPLNTFEGVSIRVVIAGVNNLIELFFDALLPLHLLLPHHELRGPHRLLLLCSDRAFTESRALVSKYILGITLACRFFYRRFYILNLTLCSMLAT
jgi:hypothetical protein